MDAMKFSVANCDTVKTDVQVIQHHQLNMYN